ncbi:SDR family NAD(P)-dependent oxidoreductase [Pseudomonas aeruginosa]
MRLLITASSERIRQRAEELSACGHDVRAASADLTDEAQVQGSADWAEAQWGRVRHPRNNAGMAQLNSAEPFSAVEATSAGLATVSVAQPDQCFPAHPRPAAGHARSAATGGSSTSPPPPEPAAATRAKRRA